MRIASGVALLGVVVTGCQTYRPGSFRYRSLPFPEARVTVACLDLGIQRRSDYEGQAVLEYTFGNRCEHAQQIDLAYARVVGRDDEGNEHVLTPFDPRGEILPKPIDSGLSGREAIAYPSDRVMAQVCVDTASIAHVQHEHWMCFARSPDPEPPRPMDTLPPSEQLDPAEQDGAIEATGRTLIDDDRRAEVP